MPLNAHVGNRPIFDDDGFVHGAVKTVELMTHKKGNDEWESYRWLFEVPGTLRPFQFSELSGMKIYPPDDTGTVKGLSLIVVNLGILTMEDLQKDVLPEHDLESVIGQCVRFKLLRKDGFYRVDFDTLQRDDL